MSEEAALQTEDTLTEGVQEEPTGIMDNVQDVTDTKVEPEPEPEPEEVEYILELPEDHEWREGEEEALIAYAEAHGLSNEGLQAMVDMGIEAVNAAVSDLQEAYEQRMSEWQEQVRNDPELGGANFEATLGQARKAVTSLGKEVAVVDPGSGKPVLDNQGRPTYQNDLVVALDETGAGNHPVIVRVMAQLGKLMGEGGMVHGNMGGSEKPVAQQLYSKSNMNP